MHTHTTKAAFFDRDGTLIEHMPYLDNPDGVKLKTGIPELCTALQQNGYRLFVVTNQSGIARGYFDQTAVHAVNARVQELLDPYNITVVGWYFCPHHPFVARVPAYAGPCSCRKPEPGMLLQAHKEHQIDLAASLMFGDLETDLAAGKAAGCTSYFIDAVLANVAAFIQQLTADQRNQEQRIIHEPHSKFTPSDNV